MFKIFITFFILVFTSSLSFDHAHDFHLSNSELKYKASKDRIELTIKIFIDDLESALAERGIEGLRIGTERESEDAVFHVGEYLKDVFQISTNTKNLIPEIIGTELSEDLAALSCYVKYPVETGCSDIKVRNTVLTEMFDDQKNVLSFTTESGSREYFTFDGGDLEKTFSCE